ncbi:MAG: ankyrin repeat domain-containing protein, partial [Asticcacaulis sp.]|nr:ankyrin repeat domain-containing protein [Asticcacaulis sp.]
HYAASQGNLHHIEALIRLGADIDRAGDIGNTPLQCAAMGGHGAAVRALLAAGVDPMKANDFGDTALSWATACENNAVAVLIRDWIDLDKVRLCNPIGQPISAG